MPLPDSLPGMESTDAKIARSRIHLDAFHQEIGLFFKDARHEFALKCDPKSSEMFLTCWTTDPYAPMPISSILGDCVSNLRAALDNLICGLARRTQPDSDCTELYFPICCKRDEFLKAEVKLLKNGLTSKMCAVLKSLQPFQRPVGHEKSDPLFILNALSNRDKHRSARLSALYSRNTQFIIQGNDGRLYTASIEKPWFAEEVYTVPLSIPPEAAEGGVHMAVKGKHGLIFRDDGPWTDRPINEILIACSKYVEERVIPRFKPFFDQNLSGAGAPS